jgi:hypothetical protein
VAYGAAWVNETSQTILGTKEMQSSGVRVQVEFSGPHTNDMSTLNHVKSNISVQRQGGEYEMGKFDV